MVEKDTIRLLRECDAGAKMGMTSLDETMGYVKNKTLRSKLKDSLKENTRLRSEITSQLHKYHDEGKDPALIAQGMSWLKTNAKLMTDPSDESVADLITDGCNMGVKSLTKYLNKYKAADEKSKDLARELITAEAKLAEDMREYL